MSRKLSDEVTAIRMVELRNLRTLHARDRKQIATLKTRVNVLEQEKADDRAYFEALIQKQAIQIAELQTMVFGKKKRPPIGGTPIGIEPFSPEKIARTKDSYRRPMPPASAVTQEVAAPLPDACTCGGHFDPDTISIHERYEEDIPLPELTRDYQPRLVTKYVIERGECLACGKHTSSKDLGGQAVTLGFNTRLLVCHLISVVGLSYAQTTNLLLSLYGLVVSKAELAIMLRKQHTTWTPAYTQLKTDIRAAPVVHADETPWPIQDLQGHGYAWNICDATSARVCFVLGQSRGATYAQTLFGQGTDSPFSGVRISDDYGAYQVNNSSAGHISTGLFVTSATMPTCQKNSFRMLRDGMPALLASTPTCAPISKSRTSYPGDRAVEASAVPHHPTSTAGGWRATETHET